MLKRADFAELFLATDACSLQRLTMRCGEGPQPDEERIIAYLSRGHDIAATTMFEDRLGGRGPISSFTWRSDGEWLWSSATEFYVREHHLRLPEEFVGLMAARGWQPPRELDATMLIHELNALRR